MKAGSRTLSPTAVLSNSSSCNGSDAGQHRAKAEDAVAAVQDPSAAAVIRLVVQARPDLDIWGPEQVRHGPKL